MTLYKTTLIPVSHFATPIQGDTFFGQLCWTIRFLEGEEKLKALLKTYETKPFAIISDGFAKGYLPKPKMPPSLLGESLEDKKSNRKKVWLTPEVLQKGDFANAKCNDELQSTAETIQTMHNSLNYKTFMTSSDGTFAPYSEMEWRVGEQEIYLLIDESQIDMNLVDKTLKYIGEYGYGKNVSIGKGRFTHTSLETIAWTTQSKRFMALSAFSAQSIDATLYAEPFTRFGKTGGNRAFKQPFKKPLLLASCGSVVEYEATQEHYYIGKAIKGVSDAYEDIVHQGYAITIALGGSA